MAAGLKIGLLLVLLPLAGLLAQKKDSSRILFSHEDLPEVLVLEKRRNKGGHSHTLRYGLENKMKTLAPLNLLERGPYAKEVMYRGQAGKRTQVRIDGMRVYMACTDRMDPASSYVATNNLAEVALQDPASSALQSGQAGSVNLKMARARLSEVPAWEWSVGLRGQSNGLGGMTTFNVERRRQDWALRLNGSWQKFRSYRDGHSQKVHFSQYEKQNWALSGVYRLSAQDRLQAQVVYDRAVDAGYPSLPMDVGLARGVISSVRYLSSRKWGPFAGGSLKLYYNDIYHEMDDTQRPDVPMHMDMPGWSRTYGLTARTGRWTLGRHRIEAQAELYHNYRRAEMTMYPAGEPAMFMLTWPDARLSGAALGMSHAWQMSNWYGQHSFRLGREATRVTSQNGLRQWEAQGFAVGEARSAWLPQMGLKLGRRLENGQRLEASYSYGLRGPTTPERYGYYLFNAADGYDYLGNPNLRPEQLSSYALRYEWQRKAWQMSGEAYWQQYRNYIFGVFAPGSPLTARSRGLRRYENLPGARFWGLSGQAAWQHQAWELRGVLKWIQGRLSNGALPPLLPPLQGSMEAHFGPEGPWQYSVQVRWASAQRRYNRTFRDGPTPSYALVDWRVAYAGESTGFNWELALAAQNLLDAYYYPHTSINQIVSPGRNLVLELRMQGK